MKRASERCYTREFKALLANAPLTDEVRQMLMHQREKETGFDDEIQIKSELAYVQVLELADAILRLKSTSPDRNGDRRGTFRSAVLGKE